MSTAAHQVVVVGPSNGVYYLGYHSPADSKFFVIQPFENGDLAQATSDRMNGARALSQLNKER